MLLEGVPKNINITSSEIAEAMQEPIYGILDAIRVALWRKLHLNYLLILLREYDAYGGGALLDNFDKLIRAHRSSRSSSLMIL